MTRCRVFAHRGARRLAPENTLEALRRACAMNIDGVEFDVDLTADGVPVIVHQETLTLDQSQNRLSEADRADPKRAWLRRCSSQQASMIDAGSWFGAAWAGAKIPTLREALSEWPGDKKALVELKNPFFWDATAQAESRLFALEIVGAAIPILREYSAVSLEVISFDRSILAALRREWADLELGFLIWTDRSGEREQVIGEAAELGVQTIGLAEPLVHEDPRWVTRSHEAGLRVHVYEVSPPTGTKGWDAKSRVDSWRRLLVNGVDAITTDFPEELSELQAESSSG